MACSSLIQLARVCGAEGVVAGTEKLYMVAYNDLVPNSVTQLTYSAATNGVINDIFLASGKTFVEVGLLKETVGVTETLTKSPQNGVAFWTQTLPIVLSDLTTENRLWIESVLNQPVAFLLKTKTNKWLVGGLNGQLELSAAEGGTGVASDSLIGYTITFTGVSTKSLPQVNSTIIADLI